MLISHCKQKKSGLILAYLEIRCQKKIVNGVVFSSLASRIGMLPSLTDNEVIVVAAVVVIIIINSYIDIVIFSPKPLFFKK